VQTLYDHSVASLRELLESPSLAPLLGYVSRPRIDPLVRGVGLIEDFGELDHVDEQTIVLLTRGASAGVSSYRFDTALRVARSRGIAAVVLTAGDVGRVSTTAVAIANRSGTAILGTGNEIGLTRLALAIGRELAGDAEVALLRAYTAVRVVEAHPSDGTSESMLEHVGEALGVPISMVASAPQDRPARPVLVDDRVEGWVTAPAQAGDMEMGVQMVLHAAADAVAATLARRRRSQHLPTQSREEVLTELLAASPRERTKLVLRARSLGLPIDGWHVAVRLDFEDLADPQPGEELKAYQTRMRLGTEVLQAARAAGGTWHQARADDAFLLVTTHGEDPGPPAADAAARLMDDVLSHVHERLPASLIRCGVGTARPGAGGLIASVAEARAAAMAARTSKRTHVAVPFDSIGLRRTLVEWYASDTAREAATSVLQPLLALGGSKAERLIQTLHVYLDERGSLTRTAQRMSLHRNAISYRINRVFELLDVDRENPDDLLLLQLACRARELS
jgi:sugar diacid utilization regulator